MKTENKKAHGCIYGGSTKLRGNVCRVLVAKGNACEKIKDAIEKGLSKKYREQRPKTIGDPTTLNLYGTPS